LLSHNDLPEDERLVDIF